MPLDQNRSHVGVYRVLDDVLASTSVPPGARGALYSIIDELRLRLRPPEEVYRAERISLAIHKLETAIQVGDGIAAQDARDDLKSLAVAWLDARISDQSSARLQFQAA